MTPDLNYKIFSDQINPVVVDELIPPLGVDPKQYSDILKFSKCMSAQTKGCVILGGKENCSDAVQGSGYLWQGCQLKINGGIGAFTIKGAINGWTILDCLFVGHGTEFDVELGQFDNYWYPGRPATRDGFISGCHSDDGKPIKVTVWNAEIPEVNDSNVKIVKVPWIIWFPYFCFRKIQNKFQ